MDFSVKYIESLKPRGKIYDIRESKGFGIRVLPSGVKTWFFIYRFDGQRRFMNLGHYPAISLAAARGKYRAAYDLYEQGKDPANLAEQAKEERRKAPTVSDLCEEYIERHAKPRKRSWAKDQEILNRDVIPVWGKRKAADITKRDIIHLLEGIVDRGAPAMANYCFAIIRKMFNFAVERDVLTVSPCLRVKLPAAKQSRERVLSEEELVSFWNNLDRCAMSDQVRRALKLILVTAQRPGEVIGMHTSEIDGEWWTIPGERAKNGKTHRVYLSTLARHLISGALEQAISVQAVPPGKRYHGFVFPTPSKKKDQAIAPQALVVAINRALAAPICSEKGERIIDGEGNAVTQNVLEVEHFTPHDLRRTAATFVAESGEMDEVIDAVLNHKKQGIIRVYNQYRYDREKQAALESWGRKITALVAGETTREDPPHEA